MILAQLLEESSTRLARAGIETLQAEAEIILAALLHLSRPELVLQARQTIPPAIVQQLEEIIARRIQGEPLQYIQGTAYFMNLELTVAPGVLIPRPETELLVEKICRELPHNGTMLDIGTGSGAIALAVADERPDASITAVDISHEALIIAKHNLARCGFNNVTMLQSDLFSALSDIKFDYIAANLPYISEDEYRQLPDEVRLHEPKQALLAADNGLALIKAVAAEAHKFLTADGKIIFEIGFRQGDAVAALLSTCGYFREVEIIRDLNRLDRFVTATVKG